MGPTPPLRPPNTPSSMPLARPGTQETRTTLGHCLLGFPGEPAGPRQRWELPLSDYGVQPAQGLGLTPDVRRRRLSRRIHSQSARSGTDGPAPAHGLLGVQVGADHQTADTQERKAAGRTRAESKSIQTAGGPSLLGAWVPSVGGPEIPQAAGCNQKEKQKLKNRTFKMTRLRTFRGVPGCSVVRIHLPTQESGSGPGV